MTDRRDAAPAFRTRLRRVIERSGLRPAAFAREAGLDRSTLAQLLDDGQDRLPRAETLVGIALSRRVSVDWLLGLGQREELGGDPFAEVMRIERPEASPIDARMFGWMKEAAGYRIRTVPTGLPDLFKTETVIRSEYPSDPQETFEQVVSRLDYLRRPETEIEIACPVQTIEAMARGEGVWRSLDLRARRAQLARMIELSDALYPSLRVHLYDQRHSFSVPFTVFGPLRAAIYLGGVYLVFSSTEHIVLLTRRFDDLLRAATVSPSELPAFLRRLDRSSTRRPKRQASAA